MTVEFHRLFASWLERWARCYRLVRWGSMLSARVSSSATLLQPVRVSQLQTHFPLAFFTRALLDDICYR
jgi:hypothetical protein